MKKSNNYSDECIKYIRTISFKKYLILFIQIGLFTIFVATWELLSNNEVIDPFMFSSPSKIIKLLQHYIMTNQIYAHVYVSLLETLLGLLIGTLVGVFIGFLMWYFRLFAKIIDPYLIILNALPKTALAPILIIVFGTNLKGVVIVAVTLSIVITIMSSYQYFISVDSEKIKMLKSFKANRIQIFRYLILPINTTNLFNIVKINIGMSFIGVIVAEFIVSRQGIGYLINYGSQVFNLDLVYMGVLVLGICTFFMYGILQIISRVFKLDKREFDEY